MTLDSLHVGQGGIIELVGGEGELRRRFLDMGLTPGTAVLVRKMAPLGDPIEIHLRGYELTLRKEDAQRIVIKPMDAPTKESEAHLPGSHGNHRRLPRRGGRV